jgi:Sec-independent protein translocase protein TatA
MPGLGLFEIAIVMLALIIFVRPEDLPKLLRYVGRLYGDLQRQLNHFKHLTRDAMDELRSDQVEPSRLPVETISRTGEPDVDLADGPVGTDPEEIGETAKVSSADTPDSKTSSDPP